MRLTKEERRSGLIGFWCAMLALFSIGLVLGELLAGAPWVCFVGPVVWLLAIHQYHVLQLLNRHFYPEDKP